MALTFRYLNGGYYLQGEVDHSEIGFDDLDYVSVESEVTFTGYNSYGNYTGESYYTLSNPSMLLPNFGGINENVSSAVQQLLTDYHETESVKAQVYVNGMGGSYYTIDAGTVYIGEENGLDPATPPSGELTLSKAGNFITLTGDISFGSDWVFSSNILYKDGGTVVDEFVSIIDDFSAVNIDITSHVQAYGYGEYYVKFSFTNDVSGDSVSIDSNALTYGEVAPTASLVLSDDFVLTGSVNASTDWQVSALVPFKDGTDEDYSGFPDDYHDVSISDFNSALRSGINYGDYVANLGAGEYKLELTLQKTADYTNTISFYSNTVTEGAPSMTLALDVVNGKVTGSVSSLGDGYTEDEGSIYKCSNGSTINMQNDTWIGAIFTDSKYWTDNAADLDSLLKVGTTSIMTDDGTTSISEALAENGTGYYYVCWYITRDEGTSSSDGYGYQYSPAVYYEAQSDEPEVKYFDNTKLNDLWTRLVRATKIVDNDTPKYWQLTDRTDGNYLYIEDGYLKVQGDPWTVTGSDGTTYNLYYDSPVELSLLDTECTYTVYSPIAGGGATLIYTRAVSSDEWGPVTFDASNMQGYVYLNTTYNVIETVDAVGYTIYNSAGNAVKTGHAFYDPSTATPMTTPLTDLPNGRYIVRTIDYGSTGDSSLIGLEGTLIIGTVEGTAKWVHNILMKHAKLTRDTAPVTPADYMKGIAVCARYMNNVSSYIDGSNTLSEIVRFVENIKPTDNSISFTVAQQPIAAQSDIKLTIRSTVGAISKVKISVYDETADVRIVATSDMDVSTASVNIMLSTIYRHFILDNYYRVQVIAYGPNNTSGTKELYITWPYDSGEGEPDACDHSWMRGNASNNYDGTHTQEFVCDSCGETKTEVEYHDYKLGVCEYCGAYEDDYDGPGGGEERVELECPVCLKTYWSDEGHDCSGYKGEEEKILCLNCGWVTTTTGRCPYCYPST